MLQMLNLANGSNLNPNSKPFAPRPNSAPSASSSSKLAADSASASSVASSASSGYSSARDGRSNSSSNGINEVKDLCGHLQVGQKGGHPPPGLAPASSSVLLNGSGPGVGRHVRYLSQQSALGRAGHDGGRGGVGTSYHVGGRPQSCGYSTPSYSYCSLTSPSSASSTSSSCLPPPAPLPPPPPPPPPCCSTNFPALGGAAGVSVSGPVSRSGAPLFARGYGQQIVDIRGREGRECESTPTVEQQYCALPQLGILELPSTYGHRANNSTRNGHFLSVDQLGLRNLARDLLQVQQGAGAQSERTGLKAKTR